MSAPSKIQLKILLPVLSLIFYLLLGIPLPKTEINLNLLSAEANGHLQFYFEHNNEFTESHSKRIEIKKTKTLNQYSIRIPRGKFTRVRLDPMELPGQIYIDSITISNFFKKIEINSKTISSFIVTQSDAAIEIRDNGFLISSTTNDPIVILKISSDLLTIPVIYKILLSIFLAYFLLTIFKNKNAIFNMVNDASNKYQKILLIHQYPKLMAFICTSVIFIIYTTQFKSPEPFCCDAKGYWDYGSAFIGDQGFTLDKFDSALRGYLLPLILLGLKLLSTSLNLGEFTAFFVFNSIFTAFSLTIIIPKLVEILFKVNISFRSTILISSLFFIYWRGFLLYPMADTWSLFFVLIGLLFLLNKKNNNNLILFQVGAGIFIGAALNLRPIYLVSLFLALPILIMIKDRAAITLVKTLLFVIGILLISAPQIKINSLQFNSHSPLVQTKVAYGGGDLYLTQLFFGASVQRHECGVFMDNQGNKVLSQEGIENYTRTGNDATYTFITNEKSYAEYLTMVARHPLDFFSIYTRHILNGIGIFGSSIYNCSLSKLSMFSSFIIFFFGILFLFVSYCMYRVAILQLSSILFLIAPALLTIPTAIEARYFLPIHLMLYTAIAGGLTKFHMGFIRKHIVSVSILLFLWICIFIIHTGQLFNSMHIPKQQMEKVWPILYQPRSLS